MMCVGIIMISMLYVSRVHAFAVYNFSLHMDKGLGTECAALGE